VFYFLAEGLLNMGAQVEMLSPVFDNDRAKVCFPAHLQILSLGAHRVLQSFPQLGPADFILNALGAITDDCIAYGCFSYTAPVLPRSPCVCP
jgi:hypothetical protein